jgi:hypothetical protein
MRSLTPLPRACGALAAVLALGAVPSSALAQGATHAIIVVGLGGSAEYREQFHSYGTTLHTALTDGLGISDEDITLLAEREELAQGVFHDRSTRDNITRVLGEVAARTGPQDRVLLVLIGHGTAQGDDPRFNLPGPDLAPADLVAGLTAFPTQTLALVFTGSASGGFVEPLSGPNRVLVTATRTARERNATEFPRYFIEAIGNDVADLDKDGQVSLLEAFEYARAEVERFYDEENELLTEHAVLDDNGDGEGSSTASAEGPDGSLAATFLLRARPGVTTQVTEDPVLNRLYEDRQEIQSRIDSLRALRETLDEEQYEAALEDLLVELALKAREIRTREGGGA